MLLKWYAVDVELHFQLTTYSGGIVRINARCEPSMIVKENAVDPSVKKRRMNLRSEKTTQKQ